MTFPKSLVLFVAMNLAPLSSVLAQSVDLRFVLVTNDQVNYDVKIQIKAKGSTFGMGTSFLVFTYDSSALAISTTPVPDNFSGGSYASMALTNLNPQQATLTILLLPFQTATVVTLSWMNVATVHFTTKNPSGHSNLAWSGSTTVFKDAGAQVTKDTLYPLDTSPLPVELSSFNVDVRPNRGIRAAWSTVTEVNNYGFELQSSPESPTGFRTVPGSFTRGHGTSLVPHSYQVEVPMPSPGTWYYRLVQMDMNGGVSRTEPVLVEVNESFGSREFALNQNYPNPFNPATTIEYMLPQATHVSLCVYNALGELVSSLVDADRPAGMHSVELNAMALPSGVYFYRLKAGDFLATKRFLLLK